MIVLTRVTNEDQVEVARVNDQCNWYVPACFESTDGASKPKVKNQRSAGYWHPQFLPIGT